LLVKLIGGLTLDQQAQVIARNGGVEPAGASLPAPRDPTQAVPFLDSGSPAAKRRFL